MKSTGCVEQQGLDGKQRDSYSRAEWCSNLPNTHKLATPAGGSAHGATALLSGT